jgi:hypothetical protein
VTASGIRKSSGRRQASQAVERWRILFDSYGYDVKVVKGCVELRKEPHHQARPVKPQLICDGVYVFVVGHRVDSTAGDARRDLLVARRGTALMRRFGKPACFVDWHLRDQLSAVPIQHRPDTGDPRIDRYPESGRNGAKKEGQIVDHHSPKVRRRRDRHEGRSETRGARLSYNNWARNKPIPQPS